MKWGKIFMVQRRLPATVTKVTVSAGGIVLNEQGMVLVVGQDGVSWSLPKGHVDPGEDPVKAAVREIDEESGVKKVSFIKNLGSYGRYKLSRNGGDDKSEWKVLLFFLFKTKQQKLNPTDPRHPEALWVNPKEVVTLLTHPKDKAFYKLILPQIHETT